ncbi:MAG: retroviral-like aspartic protease [Candidatus Sungbacteria bacterium]|nr:retroviral-like aspartic protease [Candidatus Sungbacteria bacterium]
MTRPVFPYGIRFQEDGNIDLFPAGDFFVLGRGNKGIRAMFHIDSGATTSILPASDVGALGIKLEMGQKMLVRGFRGEPAIGYRHSIKIKSGTITIRIPIIFVEGATVPRILGREGIFTRFAIIFDEARRRTAFLDARKEQKRIETLFE